MGTQGPEHFHHPYVVGIPGGVIRRDVTILLRSLKQERDAAAAPVCEQPAERLFPDLTLSYQREG